MTAESAREGSPQAPARALLLTLLGELLVPRGGSAWQGAVLEALESLGLSTAACRQAITRATRDGWLERQRSGRRSRLIVTTDSSRRLRAAHARMFAFGADPAWDGRWLVVAVTVPEERRELRRQTRAQLAWMGFGSLGNGVWVSPHTSRLDEVTGALRGGDGAVDTAIFISEPATSEDHERLLASVLDTDRLLPEYRSFIAAFSRQRPKTPADTLAQFLSLVNAWRRFPRIDTELPRVLLPPRWPRQRAYELFHRRYEEWQPGAAAHFERLVARSGGE